MKHLNKIIAAGFLLWGVQAQAQIKQSTTKNTAPVFNSDVPASSPDTVKAHKKNPVLTVTNNSDTPKVLPHNDKRILQSTKKSAAKIEGK